MPKTNSIAVFTAKAPKLMSALLAAFSQLDVLGAAAIAGNGGAESGGFTAFQEINPTVKGSKGGFGWFQWTGPRRRAYESWCKKQRLDPKDDDANIRYLIVELKTTEAQAISAVVHASGLEGKVKAFERAFERAGVPNYPSRNRWAQRALAAYQQATGANAKVIAPSKPTAAILDAATVKLVQTQLQLLKYNPGGADGVIGPLTRGAILAFRTDHGLPPVPAIDTAFLEALDGAKPREMAPERAAATTSEVATVVPEAKAHWWTRAGAVAAGAPVALAGAADYIAPAGGYIQQAMGIFTDVPTWVWLVGFVGLCGALYYVANHGLNKSTEAFQTGERR